MSADRSTLIDDRFLLEAAVPDPTGPSRFRALDTWADHEVTLLWAEEPPSGVGEPLATGQHRGRPYVVIPLRATPGSESYAVTEEITAPRHSTDRTATLVLDDFTEPADMPSSQTTPAPTSTDPTDATDSDDVRTSGRRTPVLFAATVCLLGLIALTAQRGSDGTDVTQPRAQDASTVAESPAQSRAAIDRVAAAIHRTRGRVLKGHEARQLDDRLGGIAHRLETDDEQAALAEIDRMHELVRSWIAEGRAPEDSIEPVLRALDHLRTVVVGRSG